MKQLIKIITEQSKKLKLKTPKIKFKNKIKNSKINYNFELKEIMKYRLEPRIAIRDEIENTLNKIKKLN